MTPRSEIMGTPEATVCLRNLQKTTLFCHYKSYREYFPKLLGGGGGSEANGMKLVAISYMG